MPPQQGPTGCPLHCVVVNVNGLSRVTKRRTLFSRLRRLRADISILVETHSSTDDQTGRWVQEGEGPGQPWMGEAFWHHGTSRSKGVAVLVRAGLAVQDVRVHHTDAEGRILGISLTSEAGHLWVVIGAYAPVLPGERDAFFSGPMQAAMASVPAGASVLVAGDWNCVTSAQDIAIPQGNPQQNSRLVGGASLTAMQQTHGLSDVWRHLHPQLLEFTRTTRSQGSVSSGRTSRWLISEELLDLGWGVECVHLYGELPGDHAAVSLKLTPPDAPLLGKGGWVFPTYLLGLPEYADMMRDEIEGFWGTLPTGLGAAEQWDACKVMVKRRTLAYCYARAAAMRAARAQLQATVDVARAGQAQFPHLASMLPAAISALQQHDEAREAERSIPLEAMWAEHGERSSYWFHRLGRLPNSNQPISQVKDPAGGALASCATAAGTTLAGHRLADFFDGEKVGGLFYPAHVDAAQQAALLADIDSTLDAAGQAACLGPQQDGRLTLGCLQAALAASPKGKKPGCDGLPYEFYSTFWGQLGEHMLAAFNEPFLSAVAAPAMSETSRTGLIVLLHKGGGKPRDDPDSYRPITLLNCDVKLVAKVMAQRLGQPLDGVLDSTQTAFVPGRWIGDNALFHLEEIDYVQEVGGSACIVGLDYSKAYDRVHRGWLQQCMQALGVPAASCRWVNLLLEGTRAKICFNGFTSRVFEVVAGCAQGSPLSPLLYVIAAQPLASRCRKLLQAGRVHGVALPAGVVAPVIHQHADDTTLHASSVDSISVLLREAVQPFCAASGGQVNLAKSWGLTVGTHPPLVGMHGGTGVPFLSPLETVRHLGLPLTTGDRQAAVSALYSRMYGSICAKIRHWAKFNMSVLGRAHVAKQVLASTMSYHATFLQPPPEQLARISRAVCGYVLKGALVPEEEATPLRGRPSRYVASLPPGMGGISQVDLEAQVSGLQAKVAAMLLHPRRAAWKPLMAEAFSRVYPGLGVGVLLQQVACTGVLGPSRLSSRHQHLCTAFHSIGLHRHSTPHSDMSPEQVGLEPLVGNHSVCGPTGEAFTSVSQLPVALRGCRQLRDVPRGLLGQLKLPPSWASLLGQPGAAAWEVSSDALLVRSGREGSWVYHRVLPTGQLQPLPASPAQGQLTWAPACVVPAYSGTSASRVRVPFLVGAWASTTVDPSVWRVGTQCLLDYTVKTGTSRIVQWQCRSSPGWVPGIGVKPKLWGDQQGGQADAVQALAGRQKRRYEEAIEQGPRRRVHAHSSDPGSLYYASWFDPSPPRLHVRQRVNERQAGITQQRAAQEAAAAAVQAPLVDDRRDPVGGAADIQPAWVACWRRAHHKRLPNTHRVFAWTLLHDGLRCGGTLVPLLSHDCLMSALCPHPHCAAMAHRPLATLHHLYFECGVGKGALQWLCALWGRIVQGPPPPMLPAVWLADCWDAWQPQGPAGISGLWVVLRVCMLRRVFLAYQAAGSGASSAFSLTGVVSAFVAEVRGLIQRDWLRVQGDICSLSGVCPSWLRGRGVALSMDAFISRWCAHGVLARVVSGGPSATPSLRITLTSSSA